MRKIVIGLLLVIIAAVFPTNAFADTGSIRHAYQPTVVQDTGWMRARVNNVQMRSDDKLVCVEAFKTSDNMKNHLGCLPLDWSKTQNWSQEFNAPTNWLGTGTYNVVYTYRAADGTWHNVTDMNGNTMNGSISK